MPKAISKDVAAESVSMDSLSFAGLICIQEKLYESPKVHASPNTKKARRGTEDLDFEFNSVIDKSIDNASNNNSLADVLFSNGHLVPRAIQSETTESVMLDHVHSKKSSRPPHSSKKIAGGNNAGATESVKKTDTKQANKQHKTASQGFGQKIIKSIATPCRDCRAIQPSSSMKEQSVRQ